MLCFLIISTALFVSCSQEQELPIEEEGINVTAKGTSEYREATIEFYPGVTEARKNDIRKEYETLGVLKSWFKCEDDPVKEVWTIFCPDCASRDSDVPIRTDPCEDEERSSSRGGERCEVKRAAWGNWCPF